jgi:hypothetical protein
MGEENYVAITASLFLPHCEAMEGGVREHKVRSGRRGHFAQSQAPSVSAREVRALPPPSMRFAHGGGKVRRNHRLKPLYAESLKHAGAALAQIVRILAIALTETRASATFVRRKWPLARNRSICNSYTLIQISNFPRRYR